MIAIAFTNAHDVPLDELGCHRDPPGAKYHCHTGTLKGREFGSKEEAERVVMAARASGADEDFNVVIEDSPEVMKQKATEAAAALPPPPAPDKAALNPELLKVVSWKIKKKGEKLDFDRIVNVLSEADIAILQGLDLDEVGKGPLHITGDVLQRRVNEKICRAWFRNSSGAKERFGILWRDSTVGFVEKGGAIREHCGEMAVIVPIAKKKDEKGIASSMFYSKVQKRMFLLGTVDLNSKPAKPEKEVPGLFSALEVKDWPAIVTGDLKTGTQNIKKWDFAAALTKSPKTGQENIWIKNAVVVHSTPINLYERFSELKEKDVDKNVSEHFPMLAEVALTPAPDEKVQTLIIRTKKEKTASKRAVSKPVLVTETAAVTKDNFEDPGDDIEAEAKEADGERSPASVKKAPNKKKKSTKAKRQ